MLFKTQESNIMFDVKICVICHVEKSIDQFSMRNSRIRRTECKDCLSEKAKASYEKRKLVKKVTSSEKICIKCNESKGSVEFNKHPSNYDGLSNKCKLCLSRYYQSDVIRSYLKKKSGKQREANAKYRLLHNKEISDRKKLNRRKNLQEIRKKESVKRFYDRQKVHLKMGGKCIHCEENRTPRLCIDHINNDGNFERKLRIGQFRAIASSILKGEEWKNKYQLLCFNCNRKKQLKLLVYKLKVHGSKMKVCSQCHESISSENFASSKYKPDGLVPYCKICSKKYAERRKISVFSMFNSKCAKCDETDHDILEIDHINNDGAEKRKSGDDNSLYLKLFSGKRTIDDLQLLCANCNAEKAFNKVHRI